MPQPLPPSGQESPEQKRRRLENASDRQELDWLIKNGQGQSQRAQVLQKKLSASVSQEAQRPVGGYGQTQSGNPDFLTSLASIIQNIFGGQGQSMPTVGGPRFSMTTPAEFSNPFGGSGQTLGSGAPRFDAGYPGGPSQLARDIQLTNPLPTSSEFARLFGSTGAQPVTLVPQASPGLGAEQYYNSERRGNYVPTGNTGIGNSYARVGTTQTRINSLLPASIDRHATAATLRVKAAAKKAIKPIGKRISTRRE